jgi:DNA-binding transcriptional MerR regulator
MDNESYTASAITNLLSKVRKLSEDAGLLRTVRYWASMGLLRPTGKVFTGKGKNRLFPRQEVVRAGILLEFSRWGIPIGLSEEAMRALSTCLKELVGSDDLLALLDKFAKYPNGLLIFHGHLQPNGQLEVSVEVLREGRKLKLEASSMVVSLALLRRYRT